MSYDMIKALHVISVIAWMAGLLYLPRLYVYHAETAIGTVQAETFKVMERRLLKAIMTPAMIASFLFGIWMLILAPDLLGEPWMIIKILCVLGWRGVMACLRGCGAIWKMIKCHIVQKHIKYGTKCRHC